MITAARLRMALVAAAVLLLVRCIGGPPRRCGDEMVVCNQLVHTGTRIVLWHDDGGYDAYRTEKLFTPDPEPDGKLRYEPIRRDLPAEIAAGVEQHGWRVEELREVVHLFVVHFDAAGTSRRCFEILQDKRNLSVHFMLDTDGTIYQTLDVKEQAWHATIANSGSIGIEIAHPGCWPRERHPDMMRWYDRDDRGWFMKFPAFLGETGVRTKDFVPRPARDEVIGGEIHGVQYWQLDYTEEQYRALAHLLAALHTVFPRIRLDAPRTADGAIVATNLPKEELLTFDGVVGHFHVQRNKQDPGPAFQWERVLADARALAGEAD